MRSRLTKSLVATTLSAFVLVTAFGAASALADDPPPALSNSSLPAIVGTAQVANSVFVSDGTWEATTTTDGVPSTVTAYPESYSYQWFTVTSADVYTAIPGANAATLTVPGFAYTAGRIAVEQTAHLDGYEDSAAMSPPVTVIPGNAFIWSDGAPSASPVSGGHVLIGSTLTADPGSWQSEGLSLDFSYQWVTAATCNDVYSSPSPISGATGSTLVVTSDLVDLCIGVVVSATAEGYDGSNSATGVAGIAATVVEGTLSGRATTTAGAGFANLPLIVEGNSGTYSATTDSAGYYSLTGLPFGTYQVRWDATADYYGGFGSSQRTLGPSAQTATLDLIVYLVNRLHGTLTDADGVGIGGALVYIPGSGYTWTERTAADGTFGFYVGTDVSGLFTFSMPSCTTENTAPATPFSVATTGQNVTLNYSVVDATNSGSLWLGQSSSPEIWDTTPEIGQTLTITNASWHCAIGATYEYQWYRDGVPITANGTSSTYTVVAADGNKHLSVKVWAVTPEFGKRHAATSVSTSAVAVGAAPVNTSGNPTITWTGSGTAPTFGDTLGVSPITWSVPGGTTTYEWRRAPFNTGIETVVGTGSTYVPPADAAGGPGNHGRDYFSLYITYEADGYAPATVWTNQVRIDWAPRPVQTSPASITGTPQVGSTLGFDIGTWNLPDVYVTNSYWTMGPSAGVGFATLSSASSFTVPASYVGYTAADPSAGAFANVTLVVTAPGHEPALPVYASSAAIQAAPISSLTPPAISGAGSVGATLGFTPGTWSTTPDSTSHEWFVSASSTGPWTALPALGTGDLFVQYPQLNRYIRVVETATAAGATVSAASAPLLIDTDDPDVFMATGPTSATGSLSVGSTLTAVAGTWDRPGLTITHHWVLDDLSPLGAGETYVIQPGDLGKEIYVLEFAESAGGSNFMYSLVGTVIAGPLTTVAAVEIDGTGTTGCCLEPIAGTYTGTPTARSYSWYSSPSATGPWTLESTSYGWAPNLSELGKYVRVVETVTLGSETAQSASASLLIDTDDPTFIGVLQPVGATGSAVVGAMVTAVPAVWDRPGVTVFWEWVLIDGSDYDIVGSGPSYTVQPTDLGRTLYLQEEGTLNGGMMITSQKQIGLVTAAPTTPPTSAPTSSPSPTPVTTPSPIAAAEDDVISEEETDSEEQTEQEPDDSATDGGSAPDDSTTSASGAPDGSSPSSFWTSPGGVAVYVAGGLAVAGGLGAAGWWFFIRKPF